MTTSQSPATRDGDSFVCECEEEQRSACDGEIFYKEHDGKRYCVLHYPSTEKKEDFKPALNRKLNEGDFDFRGVWFPGDVSFRGFTFNARANFASSHFEAVADFSGARFEASAEFNNTRFSAYTSFAAVRFSENADFRGSYFIATAFFGGAKFNWAYFYETEFETVNFSGSLFNNDASFRSARFSANASFRNVQFNMDAIFNGGHFCENTDFKFAQFKASASFVSTYFSAEAFFGSAHFEDANFSEAHFEVVYFDGAQFSADAYFKLASFHRAAYFSNAVFSGNAFFQNAIFIGKDGPKDEKETGAIVYDGMTLTISLNRVWFDRTTFKESVSFEGNEFAEYALVSFAGAVFEKPGRVTFHTVLLRPNWFVDVDSRKFNFIDVNWGRLDTQDTVPNEIKTLEDDKVVNASRLLAIAFRQLAVNAEDNNRYEEAANFRYMAMDLKRIERGFVQNLFSLS